jgi:hypothetical protein
VDAAQPTRAGATGIVFALLALQVTLVSWTFPIQELFTDTPLFHIDGVYHWYQLHVAHELASQGRLTGYDPYFAAGHVGGTTLNASAKLPSLLAVALGGVANETIAYKIYVFIAASIAPALIALTGAVLRLPRRAVWIAGVLGLVLWWASGIRWYHTAGMVSFVLAGYLAAPYSALIRQIVLDRSRRLTASVGIGLMGAAGLFLHPLFPIPVTIAVVCYLAAEWPQLSWNRLVKVFSIIAGISLALNLPWVISMLFADATVVGLSPYQRIVDITILPRELLGIWSAGSMGAKLNAGLLVASFVAAVAAESPTLRRFSMASVAAWLLLVLFAVVGAALPGVGQLQPNRFSSAAYVFLTVPASIGVLGIAKMVSTGPWLRKAFAIGAAVIIAGSFSVAAWELTREISRKPVGHYGQIPPEVRPIGEQSRWIAGWLSRNTTPDGRVLFETSKARVHDNSHMAGYFAVASGREFIGGPYAEMFFAGFTDGAAFGRRLEAMTASEFGRMLAVYNVGWIVAHSTDSRRFLAGLPEIEAMDSGYGIQTYRVRQPLSYFLAGSGRVQTRDINRIVLADMQGTEAVIKYHYVRGLVADPPAILEPYWVQGVPKPFIRIAPIPGARIELSIK